MDSARRSVSQAPETHRPSIFRRIMSVVSGLVALGLAVLLWNFRKGIADDWAAGFGWLYVFEGLLVVAFGAGAVVLWHPRNQQGVWKRILLTASALAIVVAGCIWFFATD